MATRHLAPDDLSEALARAVERLGWRGTERALGVARPTIRRAIERRPLNPGSVLLLRERLPLVAERG